MIRLFNEYLSTATGRFGRDPEKRTNAPAKNRAGDRRQGSVHDPGEHESRSFVFVIEIKRKGQGAVIRQEPQRVFYPKDNQQQQTCQRARRRAPFQCAAVATRSQDRPRRGDDRYIENASRDRRPRDNAQSQACRGDEQ